MRAPCTNETRAFKQTCLLRPHTIAHHACAHAVQGVNIMASIPYADVRGARPRAYWQEAVAYAASLWVECATKGQVTEGGKPICECAPSACPVPARQLMQRSTLEGFTLCCAWLHITHGCTRPIRSLSAFACLSMTRSQRSTQQSHLNCAQF